MVARSRPSARRSDLRGEAKTSESTPPETEERAPAEQTRALPSKRARISSISDVQRLNKRPKTNRNHALPNLKFPLRNRRQEDAPTKSKPVILTKPVFLEPSHKPSNATLISTIKEQPARHTLPNTAKLLQKKPTTVQEQSYISRQDDKRKLRSEDGGSRSKSELALFFNNYEQMLSLEPSQPGKSAAIHIGRHANCPETLTPRTRITLIDDLPETPLSNPPPTAKYDPFGASKPLHNARVLDLASQASIPRRQTHDPLDAEIYHKAHRREERKEKSARNVERERAQHEKVQLDRLLEELKGHDWLKTLGISGVTETEKKLYEPKRALFIREVTGLIHKFKNWKEEEKKRKKEKEEEELAMREAEQEYFSLSEEDADEDEDELSHAEGRSSHSVTSHGGTADYTSHEVDALAARQLHQETTFMAQAAKKKAAAGGISPTSFTPVLSAPYMPFKSFYSKRHLRDAAVAGHRRSRTVTAFGEPVPELEDADFALPDSILTEDAVRASSRRKRRLKRESVDER